MSRVSTMTCLCLDLVNMTKFLWRTSAQVKKNYAHAEQYRVSGEES